MEAIHNNISQKLAALVRSNIHEMMRMKQSEHVTGKFLRLHANESPFNRPDSQYPDPQPTDFIARWGQAEGISPRCCYLCNGTEEVVDITLRIFCRPALDKVLVPYPTRSIYERRALCNDVQCIRVPLSAEDFSFTSERVVERLHHNTKVVFLCNPNSPTGNVLQKNEIEKLAASFSGIVVVDESYIEFTPQSSVASLINKYWNIVVLRSFSHAWAAAGIRLGMVVARPEVIAYYACVGMSHPVNMTASVYADKLPARRFDIDQWVRAVINERQKVIKALKELPCCKRVYDSSANFVLVEMADAEAVYKYLWQHSVAVAHFPNDAILKNHLRITISHSPENSILIGLLRRYNESAKA